MLRKGLASAVVLVLAHTGSAQFVQQGPKLLASDAVAPAGQGGAVAISADGKTAVVGGRYDSGLGAAWVYAREGGVWSQQGAKLVGSGSVAPASQGCSVAISADGSTVIVGAYRDDGGAGAAWVFTRSGAAWAQQGPKLVGTGALGKAGQGVSVALSADGDTAIVGGPLDNVSPVNENAGSGAIWVFTRTAGVWSQQGPKLVATGGADPSGLGGSVAVSADGSTAIAGGPYDDGVAGAAWVFTRSGGVWSQQGGKLIGADAAGPARQGMSVGLAADGNTAIVGGPHDAGQLGAAWVFARSGGAWSQAGGKLVGAGGAGVSMQGWAVAISGDGASAIVGAPGNAPGGAAWVFGRSGGAWSQRGSKLVGSGGDVNAAQGGSVSMSGDGATVIVGGIGDASYVGAAWVFAASSFEAWVPVASHNPGRNQSQWRSDLGLLNTGAAAANVLVTFLGAGGPASNTTSVPARTQSILVDVVGQVPSSGSGAVRIQSDQPLKVTARSYNQVSGSAECYAAGTQGQSYPAVRSSDGLSAAQSAYLPGLSENSIYRSNIGVVNTGGDAASVLVELFDGAGTRLGEYAVSLSPGDWKQETQPFLNRAGQGALDRGYAKVTVQWGSGVFAFASVVDGVTNDPTTVTMLR